MKVRFGACGVAVVCGVFLSTCAQSQQKKPSQATPVPVVFVPRVATPPLRAHSGARAVPSPSVAASAATPAASPARGRPTVSPAGARTVTPASTASALATPQTVPNASAPIAVATISPSEHLPAVVKEPPNAPPQILGVQMSSPEAHGGEVVSGTVQTSSNVASVEARVGGQSASMEKIGVGRFTLTYRIPHLPFWMHKTYFIEIIARNTEGLSVSTAVPITIR